MNLRPIAFVTLAASTLLPIAGTLCDAAPPAVAVSDPAKGAPDAKAEELKNLMSELLSKSRKDPAAAMAEFAKMLPNKEQLKFALAEGIDEASVTMISEFHEKMKEQAGKSSNPLAKEANTQTNVWGTSTEDLAKYEKGSVAFNEFPGGANKLAKAGVLHAGRTFYEVEFVEPGHEDGMKYHLFYHDGTAWRMLGPLWRVKLPQLKTEG